MSIPLHTVVERLVRLIQLPDEGLASLTWCHSFPASQETTFSRSLDSWPLDRLGAWKNGRQGEARVCLSLSLSLWQDLWQHLSFLLESPDLHGHSSPRTPLSTTLHQGHSPVLLVVGDALFFQHHSSLMDVSFLLMPVSQSPL